MSFKASAWAVDQKVGNSTAKLLLLTLAEAASIEDASCYPSRATLADRIESSVDTVDRMVRVLADRGFISISKRHRPNGSDSSNVYTINLNREPQIAAPAIQPVVPGRAAPMRPPQPHSYAAPHSRTGAAPILTSQSGPSVEQVKSCRAGNSTQEPPSPHHPPQGTDSLNLEALPSAEPKPNPPLRAAPFPSQKPSLSQSTPRPRNPLLDAFAAECGMVLDRMTKNEWGRVAKAMADIRSIKPDLTAQDLKTAVAHYRVVLPYADLTPTAISSNWSKVAPGTVLPDPKKSSSSPTWVIRKNKQAQIDLLADQILNHPGNLDGRKCTHPQFTSQATFDECDALRAKLKAIQAELASIPAE